MDDLKGVLDDPHRQELLAVVPAVHHHGVGDALDDGALGLAEPLDLVAAGAVWKVLGVLLFDWDVVL